MRQEDWLPLLKFDLREIFGDKAVSHGIDFHFGEMREFRAC